MKKRMGNNEDSELYGLLLYSDLYYDHYSDRTEVAARHEIEMYRQGERPLLRHRFVLLDSRRNYYENDIIFIRDLLSEIQYPVDNLWDEDLALGIYHFRVLASHLIVSNIEEIKNKVIKWIDENGQALRSRHEADSSNT